MQQAINFPFEFFLYHIKLANIGKKHLRTEEQNKFIKKNTASGIETRTRS